MDFDHIAELEPWYNDIDAPPPFELQAKLESSHPGCKTTFKAVSCFPWKFGDIETVFNGDFASDAEKVSQWREVVQKWKGVCAVGGEGKLRVILTRPNQQFLPLFSIKVPVQKATQETTQEATVRCLAWCIVTKADSGFWPLVAFAADAILYIFNVEKGCFHGVMRGHGNKINALAVHPIDPSILLSASSDHTCRIYDLTETVDCPIENPHWPGAKTQALAGPAFGMRVNEGEGFGLGRCVAVLAGGPSGGHLAPVLGAAFHARYPIIATCGLDRAVKLWRMPDYRGLMIHREDKPLFSSTHVHSAQVLSITWLSDDILVSHSGPIIMRNEEMRPKHLYEDPGTLVIWRWLGLERFFPHDRTHYPPVLRGCASDYQESSSFKLISEYRLPSPIETVQAHVFQSPHHTPLILLPGRGLIHLSSIRHFKPRKPPPFHVAEDELAEATKDLSLEAGGDTQDQDVMPFLPCWTVGVGKDASHESTDAVDSAEPVLPKLEACAMEENGKLLIGVGEKEGIWIWRIPEGKQLRSIQPNTS